MKWLGLVLLVGGCDASSSDADVDISDAVSDAQVGGGPDSSDTAGVFVAMVPPDRTTQAVGPYELMVGFGAAAVSDEMMAELATRVTLVGAHGQSLLFDTSFGPAFPDPPESGIPTRRMLSLTLRAPLPHEWITMRVALDGSGAVPAPSLVPFGDEVYGVRFLVDAMPVVQEIRYCADGVDGSVIVKTSERVDFVPRPEALKGDVPIVAQVDDVRCAMLPGDPSQLGEEFFLFFELRCDGVGVLPQRLTVGLTRELKDVTGQSLRFIDNEQGPRALVVAFADGHTWPGIDPCVGWHLP